MIPKPVLPKLEDELEIVEEQVEDNVEKEEESIEKEKLTQSFSKLLGFIAAIGLPREIMAQKINEYSRLAEETGVTEALVNCIEYYFPDIEMSPAIVLIITGVAFASAVIADRMEVKRKFEEKKKLKGKPSAKTIKETEEKKMKESVKVSG